MPLTAFTLRYKVNSMKTVARIGAILSFFFFLLPGLWLLNQGERLAFVLGSSLIGFGCFAGTMLWIAGEKLCSRRDAE
jgi:hypothetical protein